ncbi:MULTISPECIES: sigma-54 dependent transcriptional regulator [Hallerella]|uniref:Two-component system nitrogen regulation response regulator GlnG/two-component system response regulator HydG n=1 Tax=Hallerella succinigenes TaxID=1896222 RepID=A0A2M9AB00_9BACT|nr:MULTISPECIES: sigma-54 dependent transcriptional regulator [Hallerella]MCI6874034.1 sigma-54 dependent transcriptional regulator [Hallerella sp.]MDD6092533.1 sigma-54 dependent transcriptional regulator [Hallerella succinigenes]MDY5029100.1 sigma-54 dependent transcriptional regulator [Hallerella succinigenes]PJJ42793.1 two-component system nitrogen regulation response regulator GlnG/two-component system response regulator HydG [Hallerella succinigenes]
MNVLLADADRRVIDHVTSTWSLSDVSLFTVLNSTALFNTIEENHIDFAFIDISLLLHKDVDVISFLKSHNPDAEVILLCTQSTAKEAEKALSHGAASYLVKPVEVRTLEDVAKKYLQGLEHSSSYRELQDHLLGNLLGDTPEMQKILRLLNKVAPTTSSVLITGESGSGKEFIARIVHRLSKRANEPFVAVNCSAIPENLVESELFGSKKGSFTGATADKKGLFEEANGGTLFLDEIGDLSLATQVKLLRFLQSHETRRVGETETRYLDVRIIAATNADLSKAMANKTFREDLYYRLNTFHLNVPPLRERRSTIPSLVKYFILQFEKEQNKLIQKIEPAAQMALATYNYPGNVRELENIIEHAIVLSENGTIRLEDLPEELSSQPLRQNKELLPAPKKHSPSNEEPFESVQSNSEVKAIGYGNPEEIITLDELEKRHILHALDVCKGNKTEVAERLGISRATLWRKLKDHKIEI